MANLKFPDIVKILATLADGDTLAAVDVSDLDDSVDGSTALLTALVIKTYVLLNRAIGTDVQAYTAALAAVTGTNTGDEVTATNAVEGILEIITAAEYLTKTASKIVDINVAYAAAAEITKASATTISIDLDLGINFDIDPLDHNTTIANFANKQIMQHGRVRVKRGKTGGTIGWGTDFNSVDGIASFTSPNTLEVVATGTAQLAGASGSVDGIQINSVEIMSGAEAFDTSLTQTAINVAANITANTSAPDYTATSSTDTVTVIAADGVGAGANGFTLVTSLTTMTSTDINMGSVITGVDGSLSHFYYTVNKDGSVTIGPELDVKVS